MWLNLEAVLFSEFGRPEAIAFFRIAYSRGLEIEPQGDKRKSSGHGDSLPQQAGGLPKRKMYVVLLGAAQGEWRSDQPGGGMGK
jgi:hypothetical protein